MTDAATELTARIISETPEPLPVLARTMAGMKPGKAINPSTLFRWVARGIVLPDGRRVYLEAIRLGHHFLSSRAALARFIAVQTAAHQQADSQPTPRTASRASRDGAAASARLKAMGGKKRRETADVA